jgi:hypothetical protein
MIMTGKPFPEMLLIAGLILLFPLVLLANEGSVAGEASRQDDQKNAGTWAGSYSTDSGATGSLTYILRKDEKGQWGGTVKYTNQDGEHVAEFKALEIVAGKLKGKIETPDNQAEIMIEGEFQADRFSGTYSVIPKGSTDVAEKGKFEVTRSAATKTSP